MVAVEIDPKDWPKDKIKDEGCWSDPEACRNNQVTSTVNIAAAMETRKS
jgi:hypothetical protein